jgi:dTMP kinase
MKGGKGIFIALEGLDGCGKSTQAELLTTTLKEEGYDIMRVEEPGTTKLGHKIRSILLHSENTEISPLAELFLYEVSRSQMVKEKLLPALEEGKIVITDRFALSSVAYQGFGRGVGRETAETLNRIATGNLKPDLTVLLDIPVDLALSRKKGKLDRIEREDRKFYSLVKRGYEEGIQNEPNSVVLNGELEKEILHQKIISEVKKLFD